jgi:hypothetical protein
MAYTPELTQSDSAMLRRLAWASGLPMTKTLHEALAFVSTKVNRASMCKHCQDRSRCAECCFNKN